MWNCGPGGPQEVLLGTICQPYSILQMGNLRFREGQPPTLDVSQQGKGWEARAGSRTAL